MQYFYSKGWFRAKKKSVAMYAEEEAKQRHDNKDLYCVLVDDVIEPYAFIEINNDFYGVCFLDNKLRENLIYQFVLQANGKLFLQTAVYREYKGDTDKIVSATSYTFKPSGETKITKVNLVNNKKTESDITSNVESNWESLPNFGEYDNLLKVER